MSSNFSCETVPLGRTNLVTPIVKSGIGKTPFSNAVGRYIINNADKSHLRHSKKGDSSYTPT